METILLAKLRGGNWPCRDADKLNFVLLTEPTINASLVRDDVELIYHTTHSIIPIEMEQLPMR